MHIDIRSIDVCSVICAKRLPDLSQLELYSCPNSIKYRAMKPTVLSRKKIIRKMVEKRLTQTKNARRTAVNEAIGLNEKAKLMLTRKQLELLKFINTRVKRDGITPSFEEMKDALNLRSKSGVHRLVLALEERGFINRLAQRARAIEVIRLPDAVDGGVVIPTGRVGLKSKIANDDKSAPSRAAMPVSNLHALELPVMGRIAAGTPIEAISSVSHHVTVPGTMLSGRGHHYALEVKGDSMIDAGINDGDVVVIRQQVTAENGDIVVALIEEQEATLKRFRRHGSAIALEPANVTYETQVLPDNRVKIQGRLVGLVRTY